MINDSLNFPLKDKAYFIIELKLGELVYDRHPYGLQKTFYRFELQSQKNITSTHYLWRKYDNETLEAVKFWNIYLGRLF